MDVCIVYETVGICAEYYRKHRLNLKATLLAYFYYSLRRMRLTL